jgi:ParB-like chromosome segregation protein Spo0J
VTHELEIGSLDERYARLRIVQPAAQRAVHDSMRRLGQLMPIVACERQAVFAVVDGFKRVAAARALGLGALRARGMPFGEAAAIAAVITFNRHGRGLSDLEEALVVRTLCREHSLSQVEVAELLGRHKSWVCRRLSLAERLCDAVAGDVRAGLLSSTIAREVARLPRGNQADVATSIHRHALTSLEAALLVTLFAGTKGAAQQRYVLERLAPARPSHPRDLRLRLSAEGSHRLRWHALPGPVAARAGSLPGSRAAAHRRRARIVRPRHDPAAPGELTARHRLQAPIAALCDRRAEHVRRACSPSSVTPRFAAARRKKSE